MQVLQTVLDYAAIAPFIVAAGMFLDYCWQRSTPRTVQAVVESEQRREELNPDPEVHAYHSVEVSEYIQVIPDVEEETTAAPVMTLQLTAVAEPTAVKIEPTIEPAPKKKRGSPRKNPTVAIAV